MSLRSPLGKVLGAGSAKDGTGYWWGQRVSAAALLILGAWFLVSLLQVESLQYQDIRAWIGRPFSHDMLLLFLLTLAYHSKLGIQVVIEDYVHAPTLKVTALILNNFIHLFLGVAALVAILRAAFGSNA